MTVSNPRYVNATNTAIDADYLHPLHGLIPITLTELDYPELWALALEQTVAPYSPPDPELIRSAWRQTAYLTRMQFCFALRNVGILGPVEVIQAAKGDWPESFNAYLSVLPADVDPIDLQIVWAAAQQVDRMDPFFEVVRQVHQMTPEQADAMFGYPPLD